MLIIGHRGAKGEAPENTLDGLNYAVAAGIFHFEVDLRLSKCGEPVLLHDERVDRTTCSTGHVQDYCVKALADLDAAALFPQWDKVYRGVPTLAEVFTHLPLAKEFQLEIKPDTEARLLLLLEQVVASVRAFKRAESCIITSSCEYALSVVAGMAPDIRRGLIVEVADGATVKRAMDHLSTHIVIEKGACIPSIVNAAREQGLHVSVYTVNDIDEFEHFYALGVDSIITDYPIVLLEHCQELAKSSVKPESEKD